LSYTGHCLDETFTMKDYCLDTVNFSERHTAVNLAKNFKDTVMHWMPGKDCLPVCVVT